MEVVTRYAILEPPVRWTKNERPAPTLVIRSGDDGYSWREVAACQGPDDAEEVCDALQARADERAQRLDEERERLTAELTVERHDALYESDHG